MKNLRSYLANGIPSPSCSKKMGAGPKYWKQHPLRVRTNTERQDRKALRQIKRSES